MRVCLFRCILFDAGKNERSHCDSNKGNKPLTPVPTITGCDKPWPFLPFLTSSPFGIIYVQLLQEEKIFPLIPRSRVIGLMESEICTKMLKKLSEKLGAKFPATTRGYPMVKIARLNGAFSELFKVEGSPVEGQSLKQKEKKWKKRKGEK